MARTRSISSRPANSCWAIRTIGIRHRPDRRGLARSRERAARDRRCTGDFSINVVNAERDLGRNGTFLAVRQLEQDVDGFNSYCESEGERLKPLFPPGVRAGNPGDYIGAKIVGRWKDGSPLVRYPRWPVTSAPQTPRPLSRTMGEVPRPVAPPPSVTRPVAAASAEAKHEASSETGVHHRPFEPDNDFLFGAEDPQGIRCPFGAHIRRTNPRDSFTPGSSEQLDITNRHRIMRVGRFYEPQEGQKKGLFFMCLNGDLERQFEFVQQTWAENPSFHGLVNERDPLIGGRTGDDVHSMPTVDGPVTLRNLPAFVQARGGGYFFLPGRRTLLYLATAPGAPPAGQSVAEPPPVPVS